MHSETCDRPRGEMATVWWRPATSPDWLVRPEPWRGRPQWPRSIHCSAAWPASSSSRSKLMAPDFERLARMPCPIASLASSGMRLFNSALVSVSKLLESTESVGFQRRWPDSRRGRRCGRLRTDRNTIVIRSEEHTSELQSPDHLVCRLLLEKKKTSSTTPEALRPVRAANRRQG